MKIILKGGTVLEFSLDDHFFGFNKDKLSIIVNDKFCVKDAVSEFVVPTSLLEKIEL